MKNQVYYLKNCHLLDGTKDMKDTIVSYIEITNDVITKIGDMEVAEDAKVYDLNGAYVMPGLINLHVHLAGTGKVGGKTKLGNKTKLCNLIRTNPLFSMIGKKICKNSAVLQLKSGVTTIRTVGGVGNIDTKLKNEINNGKYLGPRILASNEAIATPGGHMAGTVSRAVNSIEEGIAMIHELKDQGVDLIKLMITGGILDAEEVGHPGVMKMPEAYIKALCDEAHKCGLKVAAHIESPEGVKAGVENGVDTIEHGSQLTDDLIKIMQHNDSKFICTLSPAIPLAYIDPEIVGYGEEGKINSTVLLEGIIEGTKKCLENNITVGLGNDVGCPYITHYSFYRELAYFTKFIGVSPSFALHTATLVNAKIAGIDNITGSVEVGKQADLLIVKDNPLVDFNNLDTPLYVIKGGKVLKNPKIKKYQNVEEGLNNIFK